MMNNSCNNMAIINGWKIYISADFERRIKRTWKERLLSLPWRPHVSHSVVVEAAIPDGEFYIDRCNRVIHCNERMRQKLYDLRVEKAGAA